MERLGEVRRFSLARTESPLGESRECLDIQWLPLLPPEKGVVRPSSCPLLCLGRDGRLFFACLHDKEGVDEESVCKEAPLPQEVAGQQLSCLFAQTPSSKGAEKASFREASLAFGMRDGSVAVASIQAPRGPSSALVGRSFEFVVSALAKNAHCCSVETGAWSPDGSVLASVSVDGEICLWQVPSITRVCWTSPWAGRVSLRSWFALQVEGQSAAAPQGAASLWRRRPRGGGGCAVRARRGARLLLARNVGLDLGWTRYGVPLFSEWGGASAWLRGLSAHSGGGRSSAAGAAGRCPDGESLFCRVLDWRRGSCAEAPLLEGAPRRGDGGGLELGERPHCFGRRRWVPGSLGPRGATPAISAVVASFHGSLL